MPQDSVINTKISITFILKMPIPNSEQISLYVPVYKNISVLHEVIKGIYAQTRLPDEVIVVDDGNSKDIEGALKSYPLRIIRHERNRGLAASRNSAIFGARYDLIASLDADCVPEPEWLAALIETFREYPNIAGVCGRLRERHIKSIGDRWRSIHLSQDFGEEVIVNPPFLSGNSSMYRRQALATIGYYNEKYLTNYEDVEVSRLLKKNGHQLVYQPKAILWHLKKDSVISVARSYWRYSHLQYNSTITMRNVLLEVNQLARPRLMYLLRRDLKYGEIRCALVSILAITIAVLSCFWLLIMSCNRENFSRCQ